MRLRLGVRVTGLTTFSVCPAHPIRGPATSGWAGRLAAAKRPPRYAGEPMPLSDLIAPARRVAVVSRPAEN